jgi:hypothetical protein
MRSRLGGSAWATGSSSARGRAGGLLLRIGGAGLSKHGPASCWGRCKKRRCVHGCGTRSVTVTRTQVWYHGAAPAGPHDRMIPPIPHWHAANLKSEGASCRQNSGSGQPPSVRSPSVYTAARDTASVGQNLKYLFKTGFGPSRQDSQPQYVRLCQWARGSRFPHFQAGRWLWECAVRAHCD